MTTPLSLAGDTPPDDGAATLRATPGEARPVQRLLDALLDGSHPHLQRRRLTATGLDMLDRVLDGGLRAHDLVLVGGTPGVGKTVASLQMARHAALQGQQAIYVCYEHDDVALLGRLLCLEMGAHATAEGAADADYARGAVLKALTGERDLTEVLTREPLVQAAFRRVAAYAERLWLVRGSGAHTGLPELQAIVAAAGGNGAVLFVDYLQKVAVRPEPVDEAEKVTRVTEGLKELALTHGIAVVAIVAADREGLKAPRLRLHHLRGSSALAYECDVAILLNDKHQIVSKVHLAYDPVRAQSFKQQVVFSLEKNRGGPALVDLEFRKHFSQFRFDPEGSFVTESLVDERVQAE